MRTPVRVTGVPASFEVAVNGKRVATIGVAGRGGINASVGAWKGRDYPASLSLHLGGTDSNVVVWDRFYTWPSPRLRIGDEVTIRVGHPGRADRAKFVTKHHRLDARDMPGPQNPSYAVARHIALWTDGKDVLLAATHAGNAVRLTPKTSRKIAAAMIEAARQAENRRARR